MCHGMTQLRFNTLLNEYIDCASFASFGRMFQSIAPLYLKLLFRKSLFGLGGVRSVALFLRWSLFRMWNPRVVGSISGSSDVGRRNFSHAFYFSFNYYIYIFFFIFMKLHGFIDMYAK